MESSRVRHVVHIKDKELYVFFTGLLKKGRDLFLVPYLGLGLQLFSFSFTLKIFLRLSRIIALFELIFKKRMKKVQSNSDIRL